MHSALVYRQVDALVDQIHEDGCLHCSGEVEIHEVYQTLSRETVASVSCKARKTADCDERQVRFL